MKKRVLIIAMAMIMALVMTGCADDKKCAGAADDGKLNIVTTIFPQYDWAKEIIGDKAADAEVTLLLDNGADLHSYQPSAEDIMKITNADIFVYVGGESDEWVDDVVEGSITDKTKVINLMDVLGDKAKEEEVAEGMQEEHDSDKDDKHESEKYDEDHEEGQEYDEHVWLSLRNTRVIVQEMAEVFSDADPENKDAYEKNAEEYLSRLDDLDARYQKTVKDAEVKTLLFGDRFPFRYLTDDYGIRYYAAFAGCSAETEASFETITFLADKVDELGLRNVMIIDGSDGKIADTIIKNTKRKDQTVLALDSMQSTVSKEIENGKTYITTMESNLKVIKKALN